jgi:hypothetical protein
MVQVIAGLIHDPGLGRSVPKFPVTAVYREPQDPVFCDDGMIGSHNRRQVIPNSLHQEERDATSISIRVATSNPAVPGCF